MSLNIEHQTNGLYKGLYTGLYKGYLTYETVTQKIFFLS